MVSTSLTPSLPLGQGPAVKFKESETKAAAEVSPELSTQVCSEQGRVFRESQAVVNWGGEGGSPEETQEGHRLRTRWPPFLMAHKDQRT